MTKLSIAPGKLIIQGEYSLMEGFPGIVMAVNRYVKCVKMPFLRERLFGLNCDNFEKSRIICALLKKETVNNKNYFSQLCWKTKSKDLYLNGLKLGLGSSAALVSAICALFLFNKKKAQCDADCVFSFVLDFYFNDLNGAGSGIDLAASCFGGILKYSIENQKNYYVEKINLDSFPLSNLVCLYTGKPQSTSNYLKRVNFFKTHNPAIYRESISGLADGFFLSKNTYWGTNLFLTGKILIKPWTTQLKLCFFLVK